MRQDLVAPSAEGGRGPVVGLQWFGWSLLAVGMVLAISASIFVKADADADARREFDFACDEIQLNIAARLAANAGILYSGAALFDASNLVERDEWRAFIRSLRIEEQLPGTQGVGFAQLIPREQLAGHLRAVRDEGFPDYAVRPAGAREVYSSIIYLEPFEGRNLRAFGYDMLSEPVRRAAMERARDENRGGRKNTRYACRSMTETRPPKAHCCTTTKAALPAPKSPPSSAPGSFQSSTPGAGGRSASPKPAARPHWRTTVPSG